MFKKAAVLCIFISAGILFTGCFGGMEVNDRAFVQLMGLDRRSGTYMVTLQIYRSESGSADPDTTKANSTAVSGSGETVSAALADAELKAGKSLFLGHIKMLIVGSGLEDPSDELSLFSDGSISPSCPVVFAEDPLAAAGTLPEEGSFSAERFLDLMAAAAAQGKTVYTSAADVISERSSALPVISADSDNGSVSFDGIVFSGAEGIYGFIPKDDVPGVKILQNGFEKDDRITVPVSVNGRRASAEITGAKTALKADISDGQLKIYADIHLKIRTKEDPFGIPEEAVEKAVRESMRDTCTRAFAASAWENSCDIFRIEKPVRKYCSDLYSDYNANSGKYLSESRLTLTITSERA